MILWMLEDSDKGKDEVLPKGKGKNPSGNWQRKGSRKRWKRWCDIIRTSEHTENPRSVLELRVKQVINLRTAGQTLADGHSNRVQDSQILLEREVM